VVLPVSIALWHISHPNANGCGSPAVGLGYVALFGIGSIIGMGALSMVIAVPFVVSARWLTWANYGLQGAAGLVTLAIGIMTVVNMVLA